MKPLLLLGLVAFLLVGCAEPLRTPSGRPETLVVAASREVAETKVANFFVNGGFIAKAPDRLTLRFEREGDFLASFFFGTDWDSRAFYRIDVTVLPVQDAAHYRVIALPLVIGNRGTGFEREHELSGAGYRSLQVMLDELAEGAPKPYDKKQEATPVRGK